MFSRQDGHHVVQIGDGLYDIDDSVGTITLFAQPNTDSSHDDKTTDDGEITANTKLHHNIQHKEFYALTAGHCVEDGREYTVKRGDKSFLLGECILKFDSKSTAGESVDVGVIRVYDHCIRKVHIDPYFRKGKDVKYDVKIKDAKEGDYVLLYKPEKMNTELVVCRTGETVSDGDGKCADGFTYKAVDTLENEADEEGCGIIPGDSGTVVWQDVGPGKAEVYGMVVACLYSGSCGSMHCTTKAGKPARLDGDDGDSDVQVQPSSVEPDVLVRKVTEGNAGLADNPTNTGIAIPMQRTLGYIAQRLGIQLEPFQAKQASIVLPAADDKRDAQPATVAVDS